MMLFKDSTKLKKINKITIKSQFRHLTGFFISIAVCAILFLIDLQDGIPETFIYLIVCVSIIVLSVFLLHFQYLYFNVGVKVELIDRDSFIYYCRNGNEKIIRKDDVDSVVKYVSNAHASGGRYVLPTDNYHYQKIQLKNGDYFIITSLIFHDFNFFPEKTFTKKRIIAIIT